MSCLANISTEVFLKILNNDNSPTIILKPYIINIAILTVLKFTILLFFVFFNLLVYTCVSCYIMRKHVMFIS